MLSRRFYLGGKGYTQVLSLGRLATLRPCAGRGRRAGEGVYTEPDPCLQGPSSLLTERESTQHAKCIEREKQGATSFSCDKATATSVSVTLSAEMEAQGKNL